MNSGLKHGRDIVYTQPCHLNLMSTQNTEQKSSIKPRKRAKGKRKATSPLNDTGHCSEQSGQVNTSNGQVKPSNKGKKKHKNKQSVFVFPDPRAVPVMDFTQQGSYGMQSQGSNPSVFGQGASMVSSPTYQTPSSQHAFTGPPAHLPPPPPMSQMSAPPNWASELINDVKQIKLSLGKLDQIEKTVNMINLKVSDLEVKVGSMDTRLGEVEKSCTFNSAENDDRKRELSSAKSEIKTLKDKCRTLEDNSKSIQEKNVKLESKLTDLEARSMRDNLLFYGIPEGGDNENCEEHVKRFCAKKLFIHDAREMKFDRVHRVGTPGLNKIRPIVAKFHYYQQRETVRQKSYDYSEELKNAKVGVGVQWPQQVREARKVLYPIMQREKNNGKTVKLVRDKLLVDGVEYVPPPPQPTNRR